MSARDCPSCRREVGSRVLDTKVQDRGHYPGLLQRRRECPLCKHRWNTVELYVVHYEQLRVFQAIHARTVNDGQPDP